MAGKRSDLDRTEGMIGKIGKKKSDPPKFLTRVSSNYKPGDYVDEDEFEKAHQKQHGKFPQLSVQDYSRVKSDAKGNYVVKLKN